MLSNTKQSLLVLSLIVSATILVHLLTVHYPLVNQEWAFVTASRYFLTHEEIYLDKFFHEQANTLGISYLSSLLGRLSLFDLTFIPRYISISSYLLFALALKKFNDLFENILDLKWLLLLVFANPLVWTFGGRGTADIFPAVTALLGLSFLFGEEKSSREIAIGIILMGIAASLKYHAIIFLAFLWIEKYLLQTKTFVANIKYLIKISSLILIPPIALILVMKFYFHFWIIPDTYRTILKVHSSLMYIATNFVAYSGYLSLLGFPFSMVMILENIKNRTIFLKYILSVGIIFLGGFFFIHPNGEMNLGPLDAVIAPRVTAGLFAVFCGALFLNLKLAINYFKDNKKEKIYATTIALGILVFISSLSVIRPAQRYLLFILPLFYILILRKINKSYAILTVLVFFMLNTFITLNQIVSGTAALDLVKKIEDRNLIHDTYPGALAPHVGNRFDIPDDNKKYKYYGFIGKHPDQILFSESCIMSVCKSYSLVPMKKE